MRTPTLLSWHRPLAWLLASCLPATPALATNGYFSHGYGAPSQGLAGVGIALPQDALAAATNPAGTAAVGNRVDLGLTVFVPRRSAAIVGNLAAPDSAHDGNSQKTFLIPDFGLVRAVNAQTAVGLAVYGNGGMNTEYASNPYARFGATGTAGVNLEQLFIAPSVAHQLNERHTVGAALQVAHQRFAAQGIGLFNGFSAAPGQVSDRGTDSTTGVGVRLGWTGRLTPQWTAGATWASRIRGRFDDYRGLFANGGRFDVPENFGVGLAYAATDRLTLAGDVQHIRYSQVAAVGNSAAPLFAGQPLGSANGPGFGWRDQTVLKLGAQYRWRPDLVLRGGVSVANQVVPAQETFFNILAPGVVKTHLSVGATWHTPGGGELSGFYTLALGETVRGAQSIPAGFGGGNAHVRLKEHIVGVSYGWRY